MDISHDRLPFIYNDGGRKESGFSGKAGDCVCRAIAIATLPPGKNAGAHYGEVYGELADRSARQRRSKRTGKQPRSARNGIHTGRKWFKDYMHSHGFVWTPTMHIGSGCTVHLRPGEIPMGRIVTAVSSHYVAIIDGVIHDIHDPQRDGTRCVYGYWLLAGAQEAAA